MSLSKHRYVLGIDPGSAKLGMSCVQWNGLNCNDEKNFSLEWMCLIHLTDSFDGGRDASPIIDERTEIVKYPEMQSQIERLDAFLTTNKSFNAILKLPGLRACIEQQEGARDINVLFRLMRINFLSGFICRYLKQKRVPFTFVPKTYKCGWSYMGTLAKKKLERLQTLPLTVVKSIGKPKQQQQQQRKRRNNDTLKKPMSAERKKTLLKQFKKEAVCAFVRRTVDLGASPQDIKMASKDLKHGDFNHVADSASQAMRYVKEMELSGCYRNITTLENEQLDSKQTSSATATAAAAATTVKIKDGISADMKKYLLDTF